MAVLLFHKRQSRDVYDYFIHGLVDSLYFHGSNPRELQEFPPKVQNTIKVYNDLFAKGREVYLKMHSFSQYSIRDRNVLVPSITIAQLGVSNQEYPSKDVNMEPITPTLDDLALSLFKVYTGSSKIGSGPGRKYILSSFTEGLKQVTMRTSFRLQGHHCQSVTKESTYQ
ncbi:hypothetical protein Tco_1050740 [Tanacetum coccineum]